MNLTEDLGAFFDDFGVSVSFGSVSCNGILDMPDQIIGTGLSISTEYELTVKHSDIGSASSGASITVDGVAYTIREYRKIDDGKLAKLHLTKT